MTIERLETPAGEARRNIVQHVVLPLAAIIFMFNMPPLCKAQHLFGKSHFDWSPDFPRILQLRRQEDLDGNETRSPQNITESERLRQSWWTGILTGEVRED